MKKAIFVATIAAVCLLTASCGGFNKMLNSNDYEAKYAAAMKYYNDNSFSRASQLFENLTMYYRGKDHAENIAWYYAQSLRKGGDNYTAAYQYKRFARQFPYSNKLEEALFYSAYCSYVDSPDHGLDQSMTKDAIAEFETFAERFPRSTRLPEVNKCLDELRAKLTKKDYEIAYGYYYIEEYRAAYESFKNFLNLYPEAPQREEAMFYMLDASYRYAMNSHEDKKYERLQQVVNDFERFSSSFGDSKRMAQAQTIYTKTRAEMAKMGK